MNELWRYTKWAVRDDKLDKKKKIFVFLSYTAGTRYTWISFFKHRKTLDNRISATLIVVWKIKSGLFSGMIHDYLLIRR